MYTIAAARLRDVPLLPAIELAAATLLAGHAPASVLAETTSQADLEDALQRGQLWVALADGVPVGFAHIEVLEPGIAHLEEIDVHPEHGRRGLGEAARARSLPVGVNQRVLMGHAYDVPGSTVEHAVLRATRLRGDSAGGADPCLAVHRRR